MSAPIPVDPALNRPPNAEESTPETLVPDVVRTRLQSSDEPEQEEPAHRQARISRRAYELAEQRGFAPGAELDDWIRAESEIGSQSTTPTPPEDQFTG